MRARGFTLIEILIVVAIVGVLALIAWPSYDQHVQRARRAQARDVLYQVAQAQERYHANHQRFAPDFAALGLADPSPVHYRVVLDATDDGGFRVAAVPRDAQHDDPCGTLTLTDLGIRGVEDATLPRDDCW